MAEIIIAIVENTGSDTNYGSLYLSANEEIEAITQKQRLEISDIELFMTAIVDGDVLIKKDTIILSVGDGETLIRLGSLPENSIVEVQDEGIQLTSDIKKINFAGAGVTLTEPVADEILVTIPGGSNSFGSEYDYDEKTANQSTSSESFQQYHRFTTQSLAGGDYRIGWYFVGGPQDDEAMKVRVQLDNSINLTSDNYISNEEDENQNNHVNGFVKINLSAGVHTIDVDFKTADDEESVRMKNSRIEIWKV